MTIQKFNELYQKKGGFKALKQFTDDGHTLSSIAKYFGVDSKNAVRLWCRDLFGYNYDPRKARRRKLINDMIKYAKTHTEEEFEKVYSFQSNYYYRMALARCYAEGIYKKMPEDLKVEARNIRCELVSGSDISHCERL